MHDQHMRKKNFSRHRLPTLVFGGLVLCLLLLNACSGPSIGGNTAFSTPTALPTPTIDPTLKNQGDTQLETFQQWIALMQQYGGNVVTYQQQYAADQQALSNALSNTAYRASLATLNTHVDAIKIPAMKAESQSLQQKLSQEVAAWGQKHKYHDDYNNTNYPLGYEYGPNGIGGWVQTELSSAQTIADYQQAIEDLNTYLANFQAMTTNTADKTPYNQPHKTDLQLMQHYGFMNSKVVVVSLEEQAVRVYQNGKLLKSFLATTGRPDRPSPPGTWWIEGKKSPTVFKANVPRSSPYWYPDTPINYAMQYHSNGYYLHDSWWRNDYGPGTNFPHQDSSGDSFSAQGSHGCVNLAKADAAWLYGFVQLYTTVLIY